MHLSFRPNTEEKEDLVTVAREASIVASSLLCNHPCIQKLDFECAISTNTPAAEPSFPVFMRRQSSIPASRSLRLLHITESGSLIYRYCPETTGAHLDLRDIGAITELETLYVDIGRFSPCFAAEIDALLERNRNTLKTVVIIEARPGLNKLRMVEHLAACKVLALKSSDNIDTATPDIDGMLVKIAGFSDAEARLAVAAAENRRRETYLVLTGVVRGFVVCWPADVTQIDALSGDCWCAIARYLKVTDICSQ
ncbi:hypothetical protein HPB52_000445 [Rhipicephalus sanguineus]|uniref:Uncharacterized protein n=1 Tax=Rhipicephalus sanguineus TaxID=34632 RepID=A0A9D4PFW4_RHISA|nr:hypothetical protein HPB52_000445 [Rhipicephalus sanguineus]